MAASRLWSPDFPPVHLAFAKRTGDHPAHPLNELYAVIRPATMTDDLNNYRKGHACGVYFAETSFSNWLSSRTETPRDCAFASFEPGSAPTTT
jgi:hypothetical protein